MITQKQIAMASGISQGFVSQILSGDKRPSWEVAKLFAKAVPGTDPVFWMESTAKDRRAAVKNAIKIIETMAA
jgi:transcriptional regulator with XRE-family HTH domain